MKKLLNISMVLLMMLTMEVRGQDPVYSQYYNAPLYLNPAFTGGMSGCSRLSLSHKEQWTGINFPWNFRYSHLSYDWQLPAGGLGISLMNTQEGEIALSKFNAGVNYAHQVQVARQVGLLFGVKLQAYQYYLGNTLVFSDQISLDGGINMNAPTQAEIGNTKLAFGDINEWSGDIDAGIALVSKNVIAGASFSHLNGPISALIGSSTINYIPLKVTAHLRMFSIMHVGRKVYHVSPGIVYYQQERFSSAQFILNMKYDVMDIGIGYRFNNIASYSENNTQISDALIFTFGIHNFRGKSSKSNKHKLGIAYDYPTNLLSTKSNLSSSGIGGSSELHYTFESKNCKSPKGNIRCRGGWMCKIRKAMRKGTNERRSQRQRSCESKEFLRNQVPIEWQYY